ncbi:MAG TPA: glycosyltransferase [Segetibacter sp.]|jgi:glycosyltransferase involved in cell wall biosynthesis
MNIEQVEISICIPAYKNTVFLDRLLNSIADQTFKNYEVVVTDDSPDDTVERYISSFTKLAHIKYFRNNPALGTPENWNEGIRRATGKWIKIMHDDDWFATPSALQEFHDAAVANPECPFLFSAFQNVMLDSGQVNIVKCNRLDLIMLKWSPLHLFKRVYVGNPSCTFIRRDVNELYDSRFKFVVDFEFYIRLIRKFNSYGYLDKVLINVGFNDEQVTKYTFLVPEVQIPENLLLLNKLKPSILRNIFVYDYYWRMFRNLKIRQVQEVKKFHGEEINPLIHQMLDFQGRTPSSLLQIGLSSKTVMFVSYLRSLFISA